AENFPDGGAIVIIALFYTSDLSIVSLGVAAFAIAVLALLNLCGVRRTGVYILVGAVLWTAVLKSGVHATLAGVIVGFFIPLKEKHGRSPAKLNLFVPASGRRRSVWSMFCTRGSRT
ncbi:Na+/H+ antiporter NhaA type, partial [Salmonella enterica subsp. enterica serovar Johannesburg str. S5-703]